MADDQESYVDFRLRKAKEVADKDAASDDAFKRRYDKTGAPAKRTEQDEPDFTVTGNLGSSGDNEIRAVYRKNIPF